MKNLTFRQRLRYAIRFVLTGEWGWDVEPLTITTTWRSRVSHE